MMRPSRCGKRETKSEKKDWRAVESLSFERIFSATLLSVSIFFYAYIYWLCTFYCS
jgi:hypothetical protein